MKGHPTDPLMSLRHQKQEVKAFGQMNIVLGDPVEACDLNA